MSFERFTNEVAVPDSCRYIGEQGGPLRGISWVIITCNPSYPFIRSFVWVYSPTCNDGFFWAQLVPPALQALYQFYQRRLAEVAS